MTLGNVFSLMICLSVFVLVDKISLHRITRKQGSFVLESKWLNRTKKLPAPIFTEQADNLGGGERGVMTVSAYFGRPDLDDLSDRRF